MKTIELEGKKIKLQMWYSLIFGYKWQIGNFGLHVTWYISVGPTLNRDPFIRLNVYSMCWPCVVQFHIICSVHNVNSVRSISINDILKSKNMPQHLTVTQDRSMVIGSNLSPVFLNVNLQLTFSRDTAGQECFRSITTAYYRGAAVSFNISIHCLLYMLGIYGFFL